MGKITRATRYCPKEKMARCISQEYLEFNPEWVSICHECNCATHTLSDDTCGKCRAKKGDYDESK